MKDFLQAIVYGGLFAVLLLPLLVSHELFFPFITGKNFAFRIIVEIITAAWIVLAFLDTRFRPSFSWLVCTFGAFIAVITLAAALGEHPATSFWSNYERMDGVVTLMHLFLFLVVLGSMHFTPRTWYIYLATSVGVAAFVAMQGLFSLSNGSSSARVDGTLGNAAYMAVYMLFHAFFAALLFVRSKSSLVQGVHVLLVILFVATMLQTGTRGTFLGLAGGLFVTVLYVAIFGRRFPEYRRVAIGGIAALLILAGSFYAARDSEFVQSNSSLARIANIDLQEDLVVRGTIWSLALEGVKERPLLGWGHGNFNFVFNQNYDASLYDQEQWFDRVHNIFLDWLIAAGIFGFVAYFSIIGAALYYLLWLPFFRTEEDPYFNVLERAVLLGLLVGYLIHNVVVFDNIISYIFFGILLALIHARVATPMARLVNWRVPERVVMQVVLPVAVLGCVAVVYLVNIPSYLAAGDLIDSLRASDSDVSGRLASFERALGRGGFGNQEIIEQMVQQALEVSQDQTIPEADRQLFVQRAEEELLRFIDQKPGDARLHVFLASFYRVAGDLPKAREAAETALSLSPEKLSIMIELGVIELQQGNHEVARAVLQGAHERAPEFGQARVLYALALYRLGETEQVAELLEDPEHFTQFAQTNYVVSIVQQQNDLPFLAELLEARVAASPDNASEWATLALVYDQLDQPEQAIDRLRQASERVPSFRAQANCFISNVEAGRDFQTPCES